MNFYAGIGSRKTPNHICNIMYNLAAHLGSLGWTLRSGGADQADEAFEKGCDTVGGAKEIYLPWKNYNFSNSEYHPQAYPFTDEEHQFTAQYHPAWSRVQPSARLLHYRNTRIMLGTESVHGPVVMPVKFVITWTEDGIMKGGTSQALRIAKACNIPAFNLGLPKSSLELEQMVHSINEMQNKLINKKVIG